MRLHDTLVGRLTNAAATVAMIAALGFVASCGDGDNHLFDNDNVLDNDNLFGDDDDGNDNDADSSPSATASVVSRNAMPIATPAGAGSSVTGNGTPATEDAGSTPGPDDRGATPSASPSPTS
jgi:hypothetical protein